MGVPADCRNAIGKREITQSLKTRDPAEAAHLLGLLKHCDDTIEVSPSSIAVVGDLIDQDICGIQEKLDEFIYILDAEEALE